jgi:hypothetical protein
VTERLSDIVLDYARDTRKSSTQIPDIIEYVEAPWGLNLKMFPVQKFILKLFYGIELDATDKTIEIYDKFRETLLFTFTEKEYLAYLWSEGRINIRDQSAPKRELILAIGRRGSKTAMSSFIASYELYKLIMLEDPHAYYGLPEHNKIGITSVATDKEQASLLYNEVSGHVNTCNLFSPFKESDPSSVLRLWSPHHLKKYGKGAKPKLYVTFKSCIAKGLRGPGNIVVILDEFAHFIDSLGSSDKKSSAANVYKAITPSTSNFAPKDPLNIHRALSALSDGRIIVISSPLDDSGEFYKLFETGMAGGPAADNMLCIQAPSWEVNVTLPSADLKSKYYKNPEDFMVEYGAQFSGRTVKYIERKIDLESCIDPRLRPKHMGIPRKAHYMGLDVGLTDDGTAMSITHMEDETVVLDFHETRYAGKGDFSAFERLDIEDHIADWVLEMSRHFYIKEGIFDQWHGIGIEQFLHKRGLSQFHAIHVDATINSKMYQNFLTLMYTHRLRLYDHPIPINAPEGTHSPLITELFDLRKERKSKNIISVFAPKIVGKHDDASDSLIRSAWLATEEMREEGAPKRAKGTPINPVRSGAPRVSSEALYRNYQRRRASLHGANPRMARR